MIVAVCFELDVYARTSVVRVLQPPPYRPTGNECVPTHAAAADALAFNPLVRALRRDPRKIKSSQVHNFTMYFLACNA
jgi:hypothetical protein